MMDLSPLWVSGVGACCCRVPVIDGSFRVTRTGGGGQLRWGNRFPRPWDAWSVDHEEVWELGSGRIQVPPAYRALRLS